MVKCRDLALDKNSKGQDKKILKPFMNAHTIFYSGSSEE
jgi:hypothetical protein